MLQKRTWRLLLRKNIVSNKLTSKAYAGLRTVIIGIFSYAYKHKLSIIAIKTFFNELNLSSKIFEHKVKLAEDNVFTEDEVKMLTYHLLNEKNKPNVISFGIVLAMRFGLRVGELCSLKTEKVSEALIIAQVGHTDIKTSKQYYLFNNKAREEALREISDAIS